MASSSSSPSSPRRLGICCFLLVVVLILSAVPSPASSDQKVTVSLYYETLCPYCANFIVNSLVKVFDNGGLIDIVDLRLVPWGNAWIQPNGSFSCQHGSDECLLNAIDACTINAYPDVNRHFRLVYCIERLVLENRHTEWGSCFSEAKMGSSPVDCYNNGKGYMLERRFADETARLIPPHRFVPWVVVNGQALQEDFPNFISYICKAYSGSHVPEACTSLPPTIDSLAQNSGGFACYADEFKNSTSLHH